jgi:hypothetical protein
LQVRDERLSTAERRTLAAIAAAAAVLRVVCYFRYRFDSDEPQHLHVAWGWTAGLVQYRDLFDNHAPLFHILTAPLLKALGEREDILFWMRAPMLVLYAAVLWATWAIARRFWSARVATAATVVLAFFPPFFLKSIEYRTDNLWNALVMVALVMGGGWWLVGGGDGGGRRASAGRIFVVGVILGVALCVSMKTLLIVITLALAGITTPLIMPGERFRVRDALVNAFIFAAGFVIAPAIIAGYFVKLGAWPNLVYGVFTFNDFISKTHPHPAIFRILFPFELFLLVRYARHVARTGGHRPRLFLGLILGYFTTILVSFWVLISPRDYLPMMPFIAIFVVAWLQRRMAKPEVAYAALAVVFAAALSHYTGRFRDATTEYTTMMHQALRLSHPGEPVMDFKGETVYRRRPFYYVLETISREALQRGLIRDTMWDDTVRAKCHVAEADGPFWPPKSRALFSANFLDMGRLRASGQWLTADGSFAIAIPGEYVVIDRGGIVENARHFEAGMFRVDGKGRGQKSAPHEGKLAVLWAPAFERGFSPFRPKDRDF